jgi:hypothetical protein
MGEETSFLITLGTLAGAVGALGVGVYVGSWKAHQLREKAEREREERACCLAAADHSQGFERFELLNLPLESVP